MKSAYGGYQQNEWHHWMGEFQIAFQQRSSEVVGLLQDPSREMRVSATFTFAQEELDYLRQNARDLLRAQVWREAHPSWQVGERLPPLPSQLTTVPTPKKSNVALRLRRSISTPSSRTTA